MLLANSMHASLLLPYPFGGTGMAIDGLEGYVVNDQIQTHQRPFSDEEDDEEDDAMYSYALYSCFLTNG